MGAGLKRLACAGLLASLALPAAPQAKPAEVELVFEADLRDEIAAGRFDPSRDGVGLHGGCGPLSWQRGLPLAAAGEGRYTLRLRLPPSACGGQPLPHKFRIERAGQPGEAGWEAGRNHAAVLDAAQDGRLHIARVFGTAATPPPTRLTGTVLQLDTLASRHVAPRPVWVWLPPAYDTEPTRRYPVLYLHDGQNVFDAAAAGAEWQVDETAQRLVLAGRVQPFIVVAVPSGPDRLDELTPVPGRVSAARPGAPAPARVGGQTAAYARFLVDELKPAIDARFRTQPGPAGTAVGGSSLGGLASLWLALQPGSPFGAALVVSPSLWWDDEYARRLVLAWPATGPRARLWLDMGGQESPGALPATRRLHDALQARGWTATDLAYTEDPEGRHDEASWARRVEGMLLFLYGKAPGSEGVERRP